MNNVGISTSAFANYVSPSSPVGKQAVGFENSETKVAALPPVEQAPNSAATDKRGAESNPDSVESEQQKMAQQTEQRAQQQQDQQDREQLRTLAARDREVRAHEQAHAAVGGQYAGSPSYTFERGPNGVSYAVGGEVPISLPSGGGDPRAVLSAAEQVQRAALAPADPSAQDRRIAAQANQVAAEARSQLAEQLREKPTAEESTQVNESTEAEERVNEQQAKEQQAKEQQLDQQQDQQQRAQRLEELRAAAFRSTQLGEQLLTLNNVEDNKQLGSVLDQLV